MSDHTETYQGHEILKIDSNDVFSIYRVIGAHYLGLVCNHISGKVLQDYVFMTKRQAKTWFSNNIPKKK